MPRPTLAVDKDGFPIARSFDDLAPLPSKAAEQSPPRQRRAKPTAWRWFCALLMLSIGLAIIAETPIGAQFHEATASWIIQQAELRRQQGNASGAIALLDWAESWCDDTRAGLRLYVVRGYARFDANDPEAGLRDFNRLVELRPQLSITYALRGGALQRLARYDEAVADFRQMVELDGKSPEALNALAYARALAGVELEEGLADIDQAIAAIEEPFPRRPRNFGPRQTFAERQIQLAAYLDTRGYLQLRLGNNQAALDDLEQAIRLAEVAAGPALALHGMDASRAESVPASSSSLEMLAVLYHHRGEIHEALGNEADAKADLQRGDELGYNPAAGVY